MVESIQEKYGLKRVINASGRMSILGVSAPTDSVMEAVKQGAQKYVEMDELVHQSGEYVANKLGAEGAVIVNSASSGIVLSIAALITEGSLSKSERLHRDVYVKNEVIMFKGHNVNYGAPIDTMVYLGGGSVREVGYANEGYASHLEEAISDLTTAILYVKSHHAVQKNMISVEEAWEVARQYKVPLIVDAAAEEDLKKYIHCSDLVIYSGSKAIEGPSSGIVAGKKQYIEWLKVQMNGIGRSMKVGKESIFGLLQALDEYETKNIDSELQKDTVERLLTLNELEGVKVTIVQDEAGRPIFRGRIQIDETIAPLNAKELNDALRNGEIAIYTRDYNVNEGFFDIDARPLQNDDIDVIEATVRKLLEGGRIGDL